MQDDIGNTPLSPSPDTAGFTRRQLGLGVAGSVLLQAGTAAAATMSQDEMKKLAAVNAELAWKPFVRTEAGWLEWQMETPATWNALAPNPFDTTQVDLVVLFTHPQGMRIRRPAFWRRDAKGHGWCLRWLPPVVGTWTMSTEVRLQGQAAQAVGKPVDVQVSDVPARQVVKADRDASTHLAWNDGTPYTPIGLNVAWGSQGETAISEYRRWFKRLADNGGNFARVWMASWCFGIEWNDTGLGDYRNRMNRAAWLDEVFNLAEQSGIGIMLTLLNHGAFNDKTDAEWKDNPYNAANGGPCKAPEEFVSNPKARELFARRLRYTVARWGASPSLLCWEWWNEINWTPIRDEAVIPWIQEMDKVIDAWDPHRRLRSTSGHEAYSKVWKLPTMDIAQHHDYTSQDLNMHYRIKYREYRGELPGKALLPGELGMEVLFDPKIKPPYNWDILHLHNGQWAAVFTGYAGTGMYWWWDHMIDPQKLWGTYLGMSRYLTAVNAKPTHRLALHQPHPVQVHSQDQEADALALAGPQSVLIWVRDQALDPSMQRQKYLEAGSPATFTPQWTKVEGIELALKNLKLPDGEVQVQWLDAHSGQWLADATAKQQVRKGELKLRVPTFERDLAALVSRAA